MVEKDIPVCFTAYTDKLRTAYDGVETLLEGIKCVGTLGNDRIEEKGVDNAELYLFAVDKGYIIRQKRFGDEYGYFVFGLGIISRTTDDIQQIDKHAVFFCQSF